MSEGLRATPWDTAAFGVSCYEIVEYNEEVLARAACTPGHYTVKVDPLADKSQLHRYGFYYTDTLLEPVCPAGQLIEHAHPQAGLDADVALQSLLPMCRESFLYGRFHRDFNLSSEAADKRYMQWLEQLHAQGKVIGLLFEDELAGFIAHQDGALVLHALGGDFRGRGLAKFLWSAACQYLFARGAKELTSSVSAANLAVVNLYVSLGFRFRSAVDIYHRLTT